MTEPHFRILPAVTPENDHFWTGGAHGELRMLRCRACGTWIHPPAPNCPACLSRDREVAALSGRARVATYTVNHQPWIPGFPPPYVIAIVELPEQAGLRLTTNLVHCSPEEVWIGMPVRVVFERHDTVYLPLFEPEPSP
ncbi:MAG: Zn-ribbon domain-containing OB-fold protein [Myxococcota bacterium]